MDIHPDGKFQGKDDCSRATSCTRSTTKNEILESKIGTRYHQKKKEKITYGKDHHMNEQIAPLTQTSYCSKYTQKHGPLNHNDMIFSQGLCMAGSLRDGKTRGMHAGTWASYPVSNIYYSQTTSSFESIHNNQKPYLSSILISIIHGRIVVHINLYLLAWKRTLLTWFTTSQGMALQGMASFGTIMIPAR